jgi:hypothetical protein
MSGNPLSVVVEVVKIENPGSSFLAVATSGTPHPGELLFMKYYGYGYQEFKMFTTTYRFCNVTVSVWPSTLSRNLPKRSKY